MTEPIAPDGAGTAAASSPDSKRAAIASRSAMERLGSPPPKLATVSPSWRVTAGTQALDASASAAFTHRMREASHSAVTAASTSGTPVAVWTNQAPSVSPVKNSRRSQRSSPVNARAAISADATGEITTTSAPAATSPLTRRVPPLPRLQQAHACPVGGVRVGKLTCWPGCLDCEFVLTGVDSGGQSCAILRVN